MKKEEFYKYYIPALILALDNESKWEQFNIKTPEHYINERIELQREIELYLDNESGKDDFLDRVAYYFDAKTHGFNEIDGIEIDQFKLNIEKEILKYKNLFGIE